MARYKYCGDVNLEYGGYYYRAPDWQHGYADAVRVQPCSDGGGQDNAWWIERLTVLIPSDEAELRKVLAVIGMVLDAKGAIISESGGATLAKGSAGYKACVIDACVAYGRYDQDSSTVVQIGKTDEVDSDHVAPHVTLRAGSSLERYVRREYLRG